MAERAEDKIPGLCQNQNDGDATGYQFYRFVWEYSSEICGLQLKWTWFDKIWQFAVFTTFDNGAFDETLK